MMNPGNSGRVRGEQAGGRSGSKSHWLERTDNHRQTHFARRASGRERGREEALRDWYGLDRAPAEIEALRPTPRPVSELVDDILGSLGLGESLVLTRVKEAWFEVVGADAARRTSPIALRHRVLTVEVSNASWRYILKREHYGRIVGALRELTDDAVCDVRFVPPGRYA